MTSDAILSRPVDDGDVWAGESAATRSYAFAINGRFLSQRVTGVQRYAREVVRAMDAILVAQSATARLFAPETIGDVDPLRAITVERCGFGTGHVWEQTTLPRVSRLPLLNLCNTAPVLSRGHVVCLHDANVFLEPDSYSRTFRLTYQALQPWIARRAMRVTTVSRDSARQLARHLSIPVADIQILPNGHEHALRWDRSRSALFDAVGPDRPYVLLLGSRAKHKNASHIINLAGALDAMGLDLVVAGGTASIFAETTPAAAPNLHRLGAVSDDDLALLFSQALCLAFPSLTEGFGLPVVEAMVCGCPVVSSDRASLPEVCGTAALLADPTDTPLWLRHIQALAESRMLRSELRDRGRTQARRFSWADTAQGYLNLFET